MRGHDQQQNSQDCASSFVATRLPCTIVLTRNTKGYEHAKDNEWRTTTVTSTITFQICEPGNPHGGACSTGRALVASAASACSVGCKGRNNTNRSGSKRPGTMHAEAVLHPGSGPNHPLSNRGTVNQRKVRKYLWKNICSA